MNVFHEYFKKGQEYAKLASTADSQGLISEAIQGYTLALEWIEMAFKHHPIQRERIRIQEYMINIANRIETLKRPQQLTIPAKTKNAEIPKDYASKSREAKPLKRPCKVCNGGTLLQDLSFCNICTHHICPKCIHLCEVCNLPVCTNDLDREVVGNVCFTHASPKETEKVKPNCFTQPIAANPPVAIEKPVILEQPKIQQEEKPEHSKDEQSNAKECVICFESITQSSAVIPCGHIGFCFDCVSDPAIKGCPICRGPIGQILRLFG